MLNKVEYSVVVPVYNSEASLAELFDRIEKVMLDMDRSFECIFVDDGSRDGSWKALRQIKEAHPDKVTAIRLSKNFGQHSASFCGFNYAKGDFIITIDDDLQCPPEEIPKMIRTMEENEAELVYGIYRKPKQSMYRTLGSKSFKSISHMLGGPKQGSSYRLIARAVVEKILDQQQNFIFIDEVLNWHTDDVHYVQVEHHRRKYRKSNYSSLKIWKMVGNIMYYYSTAPLKLMVYGGMISSVVFFLISLYFIYRKIIHNVPLGYTSLIVAILFSTSLILLSLGVIGEYLSRIYMVQSKKPLFSVKKVL
jgi:glycosyltransferase involved in cell wall biosynthesis